MKGKQVYMVSSNDKYLVIYNIDPQSSEIEYGLDKIKTRTEYSIDNNVVSFDAMTMNVVAFKRMIDGQTLMK